MRTYLVPLAALCALAALATSSRAASENLLPASDVANVNGCVGIRNGSTTTTLYTDINDGTSFASCDNDISYVRSFGGTTNSSYTCGFSGATGSGVTAVAVNWAGRTVAQNGAITIKLYDDSTNPATLIGTGTQHTMDYTVSTYADFTDNFTGLNVANPNNLQVQINFHNPSGSNAIRCSELWITATETGGTGSPPAAPTGLTATPGNTQIALSWSASTGATSYAVYRSTTSGGPYGLVVSGLTGTSYTDSALTNLTTYYYVVTASNGYGQSGYSSQVSAIPTAFGGFFMFSASWDPSAIDVIDTYFKSGDYVSTNAASAYGSTNTTNTVQQTAGMPNSHVYILEDSCATVANEVTAICNAPTQPPGMIFYDIEHWTSTPSSEQSQPGAAINTAAASVNGAACTITFGTVPDGIFDGLPSGTCNVNLTTSIYAGSLGGSGGTSQVDWTKVKFLDLQVQRQISTNCETNLGTSTAINDYISWVKSIAQYVKGQNASIIVSAQVSFSDTSPTDMETAINGVAPYVDGVYLAYPNNGGTWCTPQDLATLLSYYR